MGPPTTGRHVQGPPASAWFRGGHPEILQAEVATPSQGHGELPLVEWPSTLRCSWYTLQGMGFWGPHTGCTLLMKAKGVFPRGHYLAVTLLTWACHGPRSISASCSDFATAAMPC